MKSLKALFAAACITVSFNASASLISPFEYNDGTKTWLKLSETVGLSMDDFRAGAGGWNTKYRLATSREIADLVESFGIALGDSGFKITVPGAAPFITRFAGETSMRTAGTYWWDGDQAAYGRGIGWYVSAQLTTGDHSYGNGSVDCPAFYDCQRTVALRGDQFSSERGQFTGLFVVRDDSPRGVPEPSSLALLGLAGGLLAYRQRKRKA